MSFRNALLAATFGIGLAFASAMGAQAADLIAMITPPDENPFFKAEADGAKAKELGYETWRVHDDDPNKQSQLIDTAISRGRKRSSRQRRRRRDGRRGQEGQGRRHPGVPDRPRDQRRRHRDGADRLQQLPGRATRRAGVRQALASKGKYVELMGKESDTNAGVRSKGYDDVIDQVPDLEEVDKQSANWSQPEAFAKMELILQPTRTSRA